MKNQNMSWERKQIHHPHARECGLGDAKNAVNCVVQVTVTQSTEAHRLPQIINTLQKGDYFGEKALIR